MRLRPALVATLAVALAAPVAASDHADPTLDPPPTQDAGLTGLFAFPADDRMVLILAVHRGLTSPPPYELESYEYTIHIDLDSSVTFDNAEDRARYGGTVVEPTAIEDDATIRFRLTAAAELQPGYPRFEGLAGDEDDFLVYAGVRDDPFIFPRFFGKNVVAMAVSIPQTAFPPDRLDWLLWGTTRELESGEQVDHVGRSNRTQLGRLDFLNVLAPRDHVAAIEKRLRGGQKVQRAFMHLMTHLSSAAAFSGLFQYVFQIREYDLFPDVMVYSRRLPPGFPNGRRLEDDVAALTCAVGDCVLQEVSFIEGHWPRQTVNDRPFLPDFPYLGEPWPEQPEAPRRDRHVLLFWLVVGALLFAWVIWKRRRLARAETPYVRPYRHL